MRTPLEASCSLHSLPVELLCLIAGFLHDQSSLKPLSTTSRLFREVCVPLLFDRLSATLSTESLRRLVDVSESRFALYVRTVSYEAVEIIDPWVRDWDAFQTCFYTPRECMRDRGQSPWKFGGGRITYPAIYGYFSRESEKQQELLMEGQERQDLTALCAALPRFRQLHTVELCFVDTTSAPFHWFADYMLLGGQACFPEQFEVVLTALACARESGVSVRQFEITGYYPREVTSNNLLPDLATEVFSRLKEVRIVDSPALLEFFGQISLPAIRRCELESCWLSLSNLYRFIQKHAGSLRSLHLENVGYPKEVVTPGGIHLSLSSTEDLLTKIRRISDLGILQKITVNRLPNG